MKQAFPNLTAEMCRYQISNDDLAKIAGVSAKTIKNKLSGKTEFNLSEIKKIAAFFPAATISYLFADKPITQDDLAKQKNNPPV